MPTILTPGDYTVPQPTPPQIVTKTILPSLQIAPFELEWGVGRTHPVQNPQIHGTATWTPGEPSVLDYKPVMLSGDRDNLYCPRRLGQYIPDFSSATNFSESEVYTVNDITAPEALEVDWHMQAKGSAKIANPGLQLLSGNPNWQVRGFDYIRKVWVSLNVTFPGSALLAGLQFGADYKIDNISMSFVNVYLNGIKFPVTFSQPLAVGSVASSQIFNKALQVDANGSAKPYVLKVGQLTVSYS
jgi:hypothetical protein